MSRDTSRADAIRAKLERLNSIRAALSDGPEAAQVEAELAELPGVRETLAVYGSLCPGRENHHELAGLAGSWSRGTVRGDLHERGWGSGLGYPALTLRAQGAAIPVEVLRSPHLAGEWARLDAFEGPDYRRSVALVELEDGGLLLAQIYAGCVS